MDMEPSSEAAERENEVHKGRNSDTGDCEVTKERKEKKQCNMRGAQFAVKIIDIDTKNFLIYSFCLRVHVREEICQGKHVPSKHHLGNAEAVLLPSPLSALIHQVSENRAGQYFSL